LGKYLKYLFWANVIFVVCLLCVQIPYWIGNRWLIIKTDFTAGDVLSFLGAYGAAVGTIFLGSITIKQTEKANDISNRVLDLEEKRYREDHQPVITIDCVNLHSVSFNSVAKNVSYQGRVYYVDANYLNTINDERACFEIKVVNTGRTGLYNCVIKKISSLPDEFKNSAINTDSAEAAPFNLAAGEKIDLNLFLYPNAIERFAQKKVHQVQIVLECVNDFNEKYRLTLTISGKIVLYGNRYEEMLVPTPHPIIWELHCESEKS